MTPKKKKKTILHKGITARLRERRESLDVSLRSVAETVRVDPTHLSNIERGNVDLRVSMLIRILSALKLEIVFREMKP